MNNKHECSPFNKSEIDQWGETLYWPERFNGKTLHKAAHLKDPSTHLPPEWAIWSVGNDYGLDNPDVREWWQNHPLCTEHKYSPEKARDEGIRMFRAICKLRIGNFFWSNRTDFFKKGKKAYHQTNYGGFLEDIAIARFLSNQASSTSSQFFQLAKELAQIEKMIGPIGTPFQIIEKIQRKKRAGNPHPMKVRERDLWLCYHWISGEFLCLLLAKEIHDLMKKYFPANERYNSVNDVHKRLHELGLVGK